jgi:iron complex transport system ATP-binding protein
MTDAALELESLSFEMNGRSVLRDVSVTINAGDRWSIIGPNGAGKSTLLKCLMRIYTAWSGKVRLFGRPLENFTQRELARRIAYVPQPGNVVRFPYTVREFVSMARYPYATPFSAHRAGDTAAVESALARTGVEDLANRSLTTLSGGELQKAYIAGALAQGGDILLLDEPTAFLDYRHQAEVIELLQQINQESGAAILTVTHDVNTAIITGGSALALREGAVVFSGVVSELACEKKLGDVFGASFRFLEDTATGLRLVAPQGMPA